MEFTERQLLLLAVHVQNLITLSNVILKWEGHMVDAESSLDGKGPWRFD